MNNMNKGYSEASPLQKVLKYNNGLKAMRQNVNTPKSKGGVLTPRSGNPQAIQQEIDQLNNSGTPPTEFYKVKCGLLTEQIALTQDENDKLIKQCDHLRTLNFEYVKQLNELSASKLRAAEKIIITPEFFESDHINQKVKDFMRKLANNYKVLEKEQTKLIDHCRIMEVDIENYRTKVIEANQITEKLKKTGQSSIDSLVQSLQDSNDKVDQLTVKTKELGFELAIRNEKIVNLEENIEDLKNEISEQKEEYQKLLAKYNRTLSLNEEKKHSDHKSIYDLQIKCNHLEHELRLLQGTLYESNHEIQHMDIKIKELSDVNDNLSRMSSSGFSTSRRNLSGTAPSVSFK